MKIKRFSGLAIIMISGLLSACLEDSDFEKQQKASDLAIREYLDDNNITAIKSADGLYYEVLTSNPTGATPEIGDIMIINYEVRTLGGDSLESSAGDTTKFKFNSGRIIPNGVNYGIDIMKVGERLRLYVPSYLAYGAYIPNERQFDAHENFIVDVELLDTMTEDRQFLDEVDSIESYIATQQLTDVVKTSSGLFFKQIEAGSGSEVRSFNQVSLHYTRKYLDGTVIQSTSENSPLSAFVSSGQLVEGFAEGVLRMHEGEKALLIMPSSLAFGPSVQVIPEYLRTELYDNGIITNLVRPYAPVIYEVELLEVN